MNDDELVDYCAGCVRECGCSRFDTFTAPHMIHWGGPGKAIVGYYECENGHQWKCWWSTLWLDVETA